MILVDVHEQKSSIPELLSRLGSETILTPLEVGDYRIEDIPIERKTVSDYVSSLTSGRLTTQLFNLSHNAPFSYLLVVGSISEELMYRKLKRKHYINSLCSSSLKRSPTGCSGVVVTTPLETSFDAALFLHSLEGHLEKGEPRLPKMPRVKWTTESKQLHILSAFPGIGEKRARDILSHFGSLLAVLEAEITELSEVRGIGGKMALMVHGLFREEYGGDK